MNIKDIIDIAKTLVGDDKGLLAMDESNPTCNKRFAALGIPQDEETRRAYREMIVTTPGLTEEVLRTVFNQLYTQRVTLEGMILKPNMVLPGLACPKQESVDDVADITVECLLRSVPAAVPGIAFLSGGQSGELASARLNAMNVRFKSQLPWALTFSFARAIQQPALEIWLGKESNMMPAQQALYHRAKCNRAAHRGKYDEAMEKATTC